ncbi:hypothetical protein Tco_1505448 [Tanacetum coccineum]
MTTSRPNKEIRMFSAATTLADAAKRRRSVETAQTYTKRRKSVSTGSSRVSTASKTVSTADVSTTSELGSTAGVKAKDKGKAIMQESEPPKKVKKRVQVQMNKEKGIKKKAGGSRKKTLARKRAGEKQSEESMKKQKLEDGYRKEERKAYLESGSKKEFANGQLNLLATMYPNID